MFSHPLSRNFCCSKGHTAMRLLSTLCLLLLMAAALGAQQTTATFYAISMDSTGASVPGATVTLTHEETGTTIIRTTDETGTAVFDFLRVGAIHSRSKPKVSSASRAKASSFPLLKMCARHSCLKSVRLLRR